MPFQYLARGLFIAVNPQIAAQGMPVAQDAESGSCQADVPRLKVGEAVEITIRG